MTGMDGVRLDGTARNHRRYARPWTRRRAWRGGCTPGWYCAGPIGDMPNLRAPRERARSRRCWSAFLWPRLPGIGAPTCHGLTNFTQVEGRGGPRWWPGDRAGPHVNGARDDGAYAPGWLGRGIGDMSVSGWVSVFKRCEPTASFKASKDGHLAAG